MLKKLFSAISFIVIFSQFINPQQINIPRIEQMPDKPSPYLMRNWKNTALGYDSLVYNLNLSGQYLPLISIYSNTVNYPEHSSFRLNTVVGTKYPSNGEAINIIPSIISASLNGIDKSNQNGNNYVLMAEEFFNKADGENVYLNNPSAQSGDDWWYETMPNVFFYQLNYLYPHTGNFDTQLYTVADRWLQAVNAMGANTTPWKIPYMNYRAFNLKTMLPLQSGVIEPEASGAISWILFNAYKQSKNEKYRIGAEQSLEFLNSLGSNPSYEIQLPYGIYTAARMNAELGTKYDIAKMVNWCYEVGPLRSWGSIIGNWGGYDVSGLIGEVSGNDYGFLMNTFETAGAMVPMMRYDDRFARAIGKWVLNASNAARLLYPNYLPDTNQDSEGWSHIYDPNSYIAHEAIRKTINGITPFATGDAISGNWGNTNLALYGSSHAGIFGAIIDTTNIEGILKLDLLKTDYYHDTAYPTYLFYNPYSESKVITFNTGAGSHDIYDAVTNVFISSNVSGSVQINIPANSAVMAVLTPVSGTIVTELNKRFCNGVIIDFNAGETVPNYPPRIKSLSIAKSPLTINETSKVYCSAEDRDGNTISFLWSSAHGVITGTADSVLYTAPSKNGADTIKCLLNDNNGGIDSAQIIINIYGFINTPPVINEIKATPLKINLNGQSNVSCSASDANGDPLTYTWSANSGTITGSDSAVVYTAPSQKGNYYIYCTVNDNQGGSTKDSIAVEVRDISAMPTGQLILYYPFSGNAQDSSGNNLNGFVFNAQLTNDRFGKANSAYLFNGATTYIQTTNNPLLNFSNAITVNFWMTPEAFYDREQYPISHGNWDNRWKVSITNNKIRWTLKTNTGIKDLDSKTILAKDSLYMVTCFYDGSDFEVYINGELNAFTSFSGTINSSPLDLMIGQTVPGNFQYGFNGILDDIRIYNYGLKPADIKNFYDVTVGINDNENPALPLTEQLYQNYPNPFNPSTQIKFSIVKPSQVKLSIYNSLGQKIEDLVNRYMTAGEYQFTWNAKRVSSGIYFYTLNTGSLTVTKKMIYLR